MLPLFVLPSQGYNNSQPLDVPADNATTVDVPLTPLPSTVNTTYFNCLNATLGKSLPLPYEDSAGADASAASAMMGHPMMALQSAWAAMILVVLVQLLGR